MSRIAATVFSTLLTLWAWGAHAEEAAQPGKAAAKRQKEVQLNAEFQSLDKNGDLKLSADEFSEGYRDRFRKTDKDKDSRVSLDEYLDYFCRRPQDDAGRKGGKSAAGKPAPMDPKCAAAFKNAFLNADADKDRLLSSEEYTADSKREFDRLDKKHDGVLDISEYLDQTSAGPARGTLLRFPIGGRGDKKAAAGPEDKK